jgi:hypothetical protein
MLSYAMEPPSVDDSTKANVGREITAGMLQMLESMDN